jgi:multicomponent Na+:H+ antiporter subunit B
MIGTRHTESVVVRYISRISVPFIQFYALFVLGHGEDGPGGGFQGGVIFASAFVLHALVNGWGAGRSEFPEPVAESLMPAGAMIYGGIGLAALLVGGAFLQYEAFLGSSGPHDPHAVHAAHHFGLMGIELGVMITVSASIATLFFEMARPKLFLDPPRLARREPTGDRE